MRLRNGRRRYFRRNVISEIRRKCLLLRPEYGLSKAFDNPYVGYGHKLLPGERYSARTMTKRQADALLRKDLRKFCAMFRQFGKDSLLLATLAYNVGPYRLLGSGKIPKSKLIRKLEAGDRSIYREYIAFCNYKGKRHAMLLKRRKAEFALLYIP